MNSRNYHLLRLAWYSFFAAFALVLVFVAGCAGQRFEPVTPEDWVTWGYAEVETLANLASEARQPDPVSGDPTITSEQAAEIQATLNDILATLKAAEIVVNRGGDAEQHITRARIGVSQTRLLLRSLGAL